MSCNVDKEMKLKIEEDLLKFMIERQVKIDALLNLFFEMNDLVRPDKKSGEIWIDNIQISEGKSTENYYYRDSLILTVENKKTGYKITKRGF